MFGAPKAAQTGMDFPNHVPRFVSWIAEKVFRQEDLSILQEIGKLFNEIGQARKERSTYEHAKPGTLDASCLIQEANATSADPI